ncbi:hypothetical protein F0562_018649 [Nyssa sinensis]|uniref:SOSEKI DIX-like domain-containing protein n=1 Tax=Nyssa sinensis TaxID=561372 RepID=A0A5J4ZBE6_9ASTE|nr:hypothetical protein F0562_018649 [Nyssa sinensis]
MDFRQELGLMKKHIMRRRMEAPGHGGGGEVRRLHIIYFLSRKGRIEHPHLIRVHHLSRNGVHLRDVKRWLSELRGKDMPESFAWAYKRRYKTGYLWQDLLDEDLITPISDNEYVLKGSEVVSSASANDLHTYGEKKGSMQKEPPFEIDTKYHKLSSEKANQQHPETIIDGSTKASCEIEEESPPFGSETSTLTDDSMKHSSDTNKEETYEESDKFENSNSSIYSNLLTKQTSNNNKNNNKKASTPVSSMSSSPWSHSPFTKSKGHSGGASQMLRNLIKCGTADINESATVNRRRRNKKVSVNKQSNSMAEICKAEKLGGSSERMFGTPWNEHRHSARKSFDGVKGTKNNRKSEMSDQKPVSAAYKPVNGPNCSQCGKTFKPEKMHTHMKSCRGMKASAKGASPAPASEKTQSPCPRDFFYQESVSTHFLTN